MKTFWKASFVLTMILIPYVSVCSKNILRLISDREANFFKFSSNLIDPFNVTYDYGSVLHYSRFAFTKNGNATIRTTVRMVDYF